MKVCIVGALLVSALAGASSASATSWSTNFADGPSFSATPPASKLKITATGPGSKVSGVLCNVATATGALTGATNAGPSWMGASTFTPAFSSCTAAGQPATVTCAATSLNALSYAAGVTTGSLTGVSCRITAVTAGCGTNASTGITVTGSLSGGFYTNSTAQLTIPTSGQSLVSSWSAGGCTTLLGTSPGVSIFGKTPANPANDPETLVATATSSFKPSIVQP
jgi:hypothetical protein